MPHLTVTTGQETRKIYFDPGRSVHEMLEMEGIRIPSGCRGKGTCGFCLVSVDTGDVHDPAESDNSHALPGQLNGRVRRACQLLPDRDLAIRIVNTGASTTWRELSQDFIPYSPVNPPHNDDIQCTQGAYGLAVDLGTTHISFSVWDLRQGRRLFSRIGLNPQSCFGSDVVTRLVAAAESTECASRMARLPLESIRKALTEIFSQKNLNPLGIVRAIFVGNTPMLTLLTETDPGKLLQPRFWTKPIDCRQVDTHAWSEILGIHPEAAVEVISPLAGFVGSDLIAGVLATHLMETPGGMLIDFGTNSEIALWDGSRLWATSAAGGPAFEGCGIQCGIPAEPGAIYRAYWHHDRKIMQYMSIGGGEARGLCGSGMVDLIAALRKSGDLTSTGKFNKKLSKDGFIISQKNPSLQLTGRDVDLFQRAKSAIGVGIKALLARTTSGARDLKHIFVSGAFGRHLNIHNAIDIGLLPEIPPEMLELSGNTALAGCEHLLIHKEKTCKLELLRNRGEVINLCRESDFESMFLENLYLQPLEVAES